MHPGLRATVKVLSNLITEDNIKMIFQAIVWGRGLIDLPPGYGHVVGSCECGNELRIPCNEGSFLSRKS